MENVRSVCEIARDFKRPAGLSMRDLLLERSYRQIRPTLDAAGIEEEPVFAIPPPLALDEALLESGREV